MAKPCDTCAMRHPESGACCGVYNKPHWSNVPRETVNTRPMHSAHEPRRFAKPLSDDERLELMQLITQALEHVENIAQAAPVMRADVHKRTIKKKDDAYRPYTLKDAKSPARIAALRLRAAWDIVDPPLS